MIDASASDQVERIDEVERVLEEIGAGDTPLLRVFNKADIIPGGLQAVDGDCGAAWISALCGAGVEELLAKVAQRLSAGRLRRTVRLSAGQGRAPGITLSPRPRTPRTTVARRRLDTGFGNDSPSLRKTGQPRGHRCGLGAY